ncbi:MAG: TetR/AcrR family transcriptional regulator [Gemmatimonadaceae bacterium]
MPADSGSRDAILDAAEQLFARTGFRATTIKQIGAAAGVNSALLYYYFADKETLYREMLRRLMGALASEGLREMGRSASPEQAIRGLVEAQVRFLQARPHLPKLIVRELVDHEAEHAEEQIVLAVGALFKRVCEVIEEGQHAGVFRRDVHPEFAAISTIAQVVYLFIARPAVSLLLGHGKNGLPDDVIAAFGVHAADFALAALATPPAAGRRPPSSRDRATTRTTRATRAESAPTAKPPRPGARRR